MSTSSSREEKKKNKQTVRLREPLFKIDFTDAQAPIVYNPLSPHLCNF